MGADRSSTARDILTRPPTGTPRRASNPGEGLPVFPTLPSGESPDCPSLRASDEHRFIVRVLRVRRMVWRLPSPPSEAARCASTEDHQPPSPHPSVPGRERESRSNSSCAYGATGGVARSFIRQVIRQETAPVFCGGASGAGSQLRSHDHTVYRRDREDLAGSREVVRCSEMLGSESKSAGVSFTPSISVEVYTVI